MKRREFLTLCGLAAGAVLIPKPVARLIRDTCVLAGQPLVIPRRSKTGSIIYAVHDRYDYILRFGDPGESASPPTWSEFIDNRGIDIDCDDERHDFLASHFGWRPSDGELEPDIPLGDPITGSALDDYLDWDFAMQESPSALAYHYLDNLPICPEKGSDVDDPLGELDFIEGDRPGSNLTLVRAADLATIACLQHRLNELNEDVHIEIY